MRALLQKSCKSCTASSIETYYYTIRGLAKLVGLDEIPLNHNWINEKLFEREGPSTSRICRANEGAPGLICTI